MKLSKWMHVAILAFMCGFVFGCNHDKQNENINNGKYPPPPSHIRILQ